MTAPPPPPSLLTAVVRTYAWGSTTAIPELLGTAPTGEPQAELWIGAHPSAPSTLDRGTGPRPLTEVLAADPRAELGAAADRFGAHLPFLLKVLAADRALSVQVHPSEARARQGFAAENAAGIPLDAPGRTYRDPHHKPELLCALTPFDALAGFREPAATARLLAGLHLPVLDRWTALLRGAPAEQALRTVLTEALTDPDVPATVVGPLHRALHTAARAGGPYAAACAAYAAAGDDHPGDPGLVAATLLHHLHLRPGEALHLDAGVPHAYLRGTGVEIMANSDNVLRCGLTPKHVDVPELLRVVDFRPGPPATVRPRTDPAHPAEQHYPAAVEEFALSRITLTDRTHPVPQRPCTAPVTGDSAQLLLCTGGVARLTDAHGRTAELARGQALFVPAAALPGVLAAAGPHAEVFRATVPAPRGGHRGGRR
ncbi:mannose-6-phosphate isomerase, class I [Kitasatospora sp. NBC_01539]|uniref:mannose-6-phosphate isomerase, class I n=1 Tax=Kitasatospora sp. NBC_01539 TaxID=2903577 RepID=UPI0038601C2E